MHKNTKKSLIILMVIGVIIILSLFFLYNPLENSLFPKCPLYAFTGTYCPGCGSQRAIHQILNGNIITGLRHNFLIVLLVLIIIYDLFIKFLNVLLKRKFSNLLHKPAITISLLVVILLYWVLRNINQYPFNILAP
ncbi:DUF2752 domain-containing protein [Seonamhaeicola sediminis]|uniref:DUF2752 domain-containing protein n=2 Tax=Seonamhaeicola sediminis TaxID=2528206 RepID=A0A562YAN9_9FLAO|nr:DUF2752 domain-containing protein [Seonamhaeicola sediminis]